MKFFGLFLIAILALTVGGAMGETDSSQSLFGRETTRKSWWDYNHSSSAKSVYRPHRTGSSYYQKASRSKSRQAKLAQGSQGQNGSISNSQPSGGSNFFRDWSSFWSNLFAGKSNGFKPGLNETDGPVRNADGTYTYNKPSSSSALDWHNIFAPAEKSR